MTKDFEKTLQDIDRRCRQHGITYTIIGGIAAIVIMKLVADRTKDRLDVETLIPLNRKRLNLRYRRARAKEFIAVERSEVRERLEELLAATKSRRRK